LKHSTLSGNRVIAVTHSGSMASTRIALGGAIYVVGDVHVYDSTISGNFARLGANGNNAPVSYAYAGGISTAMANFGQEVVISGSTISGNQSDQKAGGLQLLGSVLVRNSTISGNSASFAGGMNVPDGTLTLQNSTIAFNSANKAAGIYCTMPTITSDSTIIANNTVMNMQFAPDLAHASSALMVNGADNLIMTWDASTAFASQPMTLDPGLLPLAHNGGPTMTHALPVGSPAVDAGNNVAGVRYDQRGYKYPRDVNGRADIGAYEWLERVFADGFE